MADHVSSLRQPLVAAPRTLAGITDDIVGQLRRRATWRWWAAFVVAASLLLLGLSAVTYEIMTGIGTWGLNRTVGWAFDITNFVFWVGIGHAGTLISAILFLFRQKWRTSINRSAEAMTLFAVMCAGVFPLIHMGRPWDGFFVFPYPNFRGPLWVNFRSPLLWDVFAISTYFTVSAVFWYVGLIPDLATLRDRSQNRAGRMVYGMLAMGWRGSARHWHRYELASLLLAALATPLVVSVHTIVSFDFAVGIVPGWHTTIFPPYFVAGAIYAGFAMVLTLAIPLRRIYGLQDFITMQHLNYMGRILLATGLVVAYGYMMEAFMAWYSGNIYEQFMMINRFTGPYRYMYWSLLACNVIAPQALWFQRVRSSTIALMVVCMFVNVGMWLERYIIIVVSLSADFMPSSWGLFTGTRWDWSMYVGTIGLFLTLFFLFIRFLPMISIFEMRTMLPEAKVEEESAA